MVLIKEIELALKPEDTEVQAQEDEVLADSVLELANTNFSSKIYDYDDLTPGAIRKHVEADMRVAYPGKPSSRKRVFKRSLKGDFSLKTEEKCGLENHGSHSDIDSEEISEGSDEDVPSIADESKGSGIEESDSGSDKFDRSGEEEASEGDETDDENELNSDLDGSILQGDDGMPEGSGSEVGEEHVEEGSDEEDINRGINLFSTRAKDIEADIAKGNCIRNQLTLWEKLIECRIKFQPCLINANKLYQKDSFQEFKSSLSPEEEAVILQSYSSLSNLMKELLELQEDLLNAVPSYKEMKKNKRKSTSEPDVSGDESEPKKNRTSNDLLKDIEDDFKPFRNASIQKWNEKTRVASGKTNKNDFSAFDLPTLKQIEEILLDRDRLLRRTRTKRSDYDILGKTGIKSDEKIDENEPSEKAQRKNLAEYDSEIFDDDDFYHKLLRDFIEKKTSDVSDVSKRGKQWLELQKLRSKMKAKVDTRASKGRKLRFTVHNKMVNFMAPIPSFAWSDEAKNELFKSLFC